MKIAIFHLLLLILSSLNKKYRDFLIEQDCLKDNSVAQTRFICSKHFADKDLNRGERVRPKPNVLPSLHLGKSKQISSLEMSPRTSRTPEEVHEIMNPIVPDPMVTPKNVSTRYIVYYIKLSVFIAENLGLLNFYF